MKYNPVFKKRNYKKIFNLVESQSKWNIAATSRTYVIAKRPCDMPISSPIYVIVTSQCIDIVWMEYAVGTFPQHNSAGHFYVAEVLPQYIAAMLRLLHVRVAAMLLPLTFNAYVIWGIVC